MDFHSQWLCLHSVLLFFTRSVLSFLFRGTLYLVHESEVGEEGVQVFPSYKD